MRYCRLIDNKVEEVISAEESFIQTLENKEQWVEGKLKNLKPGIGYTYDPVRDIFLPPKPFPSWVEKVFEEKGLDENNNISVLRSWISWYPPIPKPEDGNEYIWNEDTLSWIVVPLPS